MKWPFEKRIADEEWLARVRPLFEAARATESQLADSLRSESVEERYAALRRATVDFPPLRDAIEEIPPPTSPEARQTRKQFLKALADFSEGCYWGRGILDRAASDTRKLQRSGRRFASEARPGRSASASGVDGWEHMVTSAEARLEEASAFFSEGVTSR